MVTVWPEASLGYPRGDLSKVHPLLFLLMVVGYFDGLPSAQLFYLDTEGAPRSQMTAGALV